MNQKKSGSTGISQVLKIAPLPTSSSGATIPRVAAPDLNGIVVTVPLSPGPGEDDIIRRFTELKREVSPRRGRKAGEAVAMGDELQVDLLAAMDGMVVPFSFRKDERMELAELSHLPGVAGTIAGQPVGCRLFMGVVLPGTYPLPGLRGQKIQLLIDVNAASEVTALKDDSPELLQRLNRGKTLEEVMVSIRKELIDEAANQRVHEGQLMVLAKLVERAGPITLTPEQIDDEVRMSWYRIEGKKMKDKNLEAETIDSARTGWLRDKETRADAEQRLKTSMVLSAIAERDQIKVSPESLKELLMRLVPGLDAAGAEEALNETLENTATIAEFGLYITAVEHVLSRATIRFEGAKA